MKDSIKKVLLINPPWRSRKIYGLKVLAHGIFPPHGLLELGSYLESKGYSVELIDADPLNLSFKEILAIVRKKKPWIVGLTATTSTFANALMIARTAKKAGAITLLGGVHPTTMPKDVLIRPEVDFIIMGEGELTAHEFLQAIEKGKPLNDIKGLGWKDKNGNMHLNAHREFIPNLDAALPMTSWHLVPVRKYVPYAGNPTQKTPFISIFTSRGCPYNCIYCESKIMVGRKARLHSAERIIEELKVLRKNYGINNVMFFDDIFTIDKRRVEKICDFLIQSRFNLTWSCLGRVGCVTPELLSKMKKAGCEMISYGVESGDQAVLDFYRRNTSLDSIRETIKMTKEVKIPIRAFFMIGSPLPERNIKKSIQMTVDFAKELDPDNIFLSILTPFPGSEIYTLFNQHGFINESKSQEFNMFNNAVMDVPGVSQKELKKMMSKAYREFYLRPSFLWKTIKSIRSPSQLYSYLKAGLSVILSG